MGAIMADILDFSLADFHYNDSADVLTPPSDFQTWMSHPRISMAFSLFEQMLLDGPRHMTEVLNNFDGKRRKMINLTSYNYLGLSVHPEVIAAAKSALDKYGLGASGAPLVSGTSDLTVTLARNLAAFKKKEDCMLFSGGLAGNMGAMQGLLRKGDFLVLDERCHKSIVDGGTLSGARMLFFRHNDTDSLIEMLEKCKGKRILVAIEGVYSMDGDLPPLPRIVEICKSYNAPIYIDEAHSTLMFGANGRGVAEHFGVEDDVPISFGTLSKSFGGLGGFVCTRADTIRYMKSYSSPYQFSCAMPPPIAAGLIAALDVATRDSTLRDRLWENVRYFRSNLERLDLNLGGSQSQVIPIIIGSSGEKLISMAIELQKRGLFLQPIDFPAVPADARRFRISVSSDLTKAEMDEASTIIEDVIVKGLKS
jgi:7-keto-8-aminopelargonate synthetase-like enzyme